MNSIKIHLPSTFEINSMFKKKRSSEVQLSHNQGYQLHTLKTHLIPILFQEGKFVLSLFQEGQCHKAVAQWIMPISKSSFDSTAQW